MPSIAKYFRQGSCIGNHIPRERQSHILVASAEKRKKKITDVVSINKTDYFTQIQK